MTVFRHFKDGILDSVRVQTHSSDKPGDLPEYLDTYEGDPAKLPFVIPGVNDADSKTQQ